MASGGKAYFISDLHLGASYLGDPHESERRVVRFLDSISGDVAELYLVGDILDYWYEYRYVVPRGFVRFFGKIAELSDKGVKITWLIGNHDIWIFDYLPAELGVRVVDGIYETRVLGRTPVLLEHGDGVWKRDRKFSIIRSIFRNRFCQRLYASVHPRWTVPFALRWSSRSRRDGERNGGSCGGGTCQGGIPENIRHLKEFCNAVLKEERPESDKPRYFIFGHLHEIAREELEGGAEMLILGDWITKFSYAVYDGEKMEIRQYEG